MARSSDGIHWQRSSGPVEGDRSDTDVGACIDPNTDNWWTLDTCAVTVSDVQLFSSDAAKGGAGVYWMFYTGIDFQPVTVPAGLPGMHEGAEVEGLCARPGLAMSQVRHSGAWYALCLRWQPITLAYVHNVCMECRCNVYRLACRCVLGMTRRVAWLPPNVLQECRMGATGHA